tara:strand:- start:1469 stop:1690 length:222 start_codon:yes stop_codon:yes gene_type:complete
MLLTYSQSAKGIQITLERAIQELESHGLGHDDIEEFIEDCWDYHPKNFRRLPYPRVGAEYTIDAKYVLDWLGY